MAEFPTEELYEMLEWFVKTPYPAAYKNAENAKQYEKLTGLIAELIPELTRYLFSLRSEKENVATLNKVLNAGRGRENTEPIWIGKNLEDVLKRLTQAIIDMEKGGGKSD